VGLLRSVESGRHYRVFQSEMTEERDLRNQEMRATQNLYYPLKTKNLEKTNLAPKLTVDTQNDVQWSWDGCDRLASQRNQPSLSQWLALRNGLHLGTPDMCLGCFGTSPAGMVAMVGCSWQYGQTA